MTRVNSQASGSLYCWNCKRSDSYTRDNLGTCSQCGSELKRLSSAQEAMMYLKRAGYKKLKQYKRSSLWKSIEKNVLTRDNRQCSGCGKRAVLAQHKFYTVENVMGLSLEGIESRCDQCDKLVCQIEPSEANRVVVTKEIVGHRPDVANSKMKPGNIEYLKDSPAIKPEALKKGIKITESVSECKGTKTFHVHFDSVETKKRIIDWYPATGTWTSPRGKKGRVANLATAVTAALQQQIKSMQPL